MGNLIKFLPYFEYAKIGTNIAKLCSKSTEKITQIWREYPPQLITVDDFNSKKVTGMIYNIIDRMPMLEVINNYSAKIIEFKRK